MQESVRIARPRVHIHRDRPAPPVSFGGEIKGPEELGDGEEQVALGEMDARTEASPRAIAIVIALVKVRRGGVVRREPRTAGVAFGVEGVGVRVALGIVMETPDVEDDGAPFWDAHALDRIIYNPSLEREGGKTRGGQENSRKPAFLRQPPPPPRWEGEGQHL